MVMVRTRREKAIDQGLIGIADRTGRRDFSLISAPTVMPLQRAAG
jgi:hypothetical protein